MNASARWSGAEALLCLDLLAWRLMLARDFGTTWESSGLLAEHRALL